MAKYTPETHPVIAIDLDDTIWTATREGNHIFPGAGVPFKNAIKTINKMIATGYEVIIWTARDSENQAKECKKALLDAGINPNFKWNYYSNHANSEYVINKASSRKIDANIFFDDRAYGAPIYSEETWANIYDEFFGETTVNKPEIKTISQPFVREIPEQSPLKVTFNYPNTTEDLIHYIEDMTDVKLSEQLANDVLNGVKTIDKAVDEQEVYNSYDPDIQRALDVKHISKQKAQQIQKQRNDEKESLEWLLSKLFGLDNPKDIARRLKRGDIDEF